MSFISKCLTCKKSFRNSNVEMRQYCSVGCQFHNTCEDPECYCSERNNPKQENKNMLSIEVRQNVFMNYDMNDENDIKMMENAVAAMQIALFDYRTRRLKELGYEMPNENTVTVGDLIGLKREE